MRRRVVGAAVALVGAGLLALRWYDDGAVRRAGLLVLGPFADRPDEVPGLGWSRLAAALTVVTVLAALGLALSRPPRRPTWTTRSDPPTAEGRATDPAVWWAAGFAAAAAVAAGVAAWRLGGLATAAVPAAAVLLAGCAAGIPLAARGRGRAALAAGVALAAVVALGVTLGAPWYADGRLVSRTETGTAAPAAAGEGPDRPGTVAWSRPARRALAGGGYAVVAEDVGGPGLRIAVLDAATGRERWSYRHEDAFVDARISPADGVLVLRRDRDGATRLLAFDLASGRPLWTMSTDAELLDDSTGFDEGGRLLTPGVLLLQDGAAIVAVEPRTGAVRWTRDGIACLGGTSVTGGASGVLVLTGLCRSRTVTALSAATGLPVWAAEVSATPVFTAGPGRTPLVVESTVVLTLSDETGPDRLVALEAGTGRVRWRAAWRVGVLPAVAVGDLVVAVEAAGDTLTAVARDEASGRVAWRTPVGAIGTGVERVTGSDGEQAYLLSGRATGPVRVDVLTRAGRLTTAGGVPGCPDAECAGVVVPLTGSTTVVASGGALVLLNAGGFRPVAAVV